MIRVVLFDFGGVIADEGFYQGLRAIAEESGLEPEQFLRTAEELIHRTGYVTGRATEAAYWAAVREESGIEQTDDYMREQILSRFMVRPEMLAHADSLRSAGRNVSILSDQTDWLDEIDRRTPFANHFDRVFNSFYLHKSKRDATIFTDTCHGLGVDPGDVLFIDDNIRNVERAGSVGLLTIHFTGMGQFPGALKSINL